MNQTISTLRLLFIFLGMLFIALSASLFCSFLSIKLNASAFMRNSSQYDIPFWVWMWSGILLGIAGFCFYEAAILLKKRKRAVWLGVGIGILLTVIFPYGTLFGIFLLWLMLRKGTRELLTK